MISLPPSADSKILLIYSFAKSERLPKFSLNIFIEKIHYNHLFSSFFSCYLKCCIGYLSMKIRHKIVIHYDLIHCINFILISLFFDLFNYSLEGFSDQVNHSTNNRNIFHKLTSQFIYSLRNFHGVICCYSLLFF